MQPLQLTLQFREQCSIGHPSVLGRIRGGHDGIDSSNIRYVRVRTVHYVWRFDSLI